MPAIHSIVDAIDHFKPVSDVAGKVLALVNDPACGLSDLTPIICHEPALTANVLKLANSAYYGLPNKIGDVKQAVIYLGMNQVVDLVLMIACSGSFNGSHEGYGLNPGELWKSAVAGAILAVDLAQAKRLSGQSFYFTAALLRDIGKVVLAPHVRANRDAILGRVREQGIAFTEAERQVLGVDHAQVGAVLAKKWLFPLTLQCTLRHYHAPLEASGCVLEASVVHLADSLCRKMAIGLGVDDPHCIEDGRALHALGVNDALVQTISTAFRGKMERVNALFAMV